MTTVFDPERELAIELGNRGVSVSFLNTGGGCMVVELHQAPGDSRMIWVTAEDWDGPSRVKWCVGVYPNNRCDSNDPRTRYRYPVDSVTGMADWLTSNSYTWPTPARVQNAPRNWGQPHPPDPELSRLLLDEEVIQLTRDVDVLKAEIDSMHQALARHVVKIRENLEKIETAKRLLRELKP